MLDTLKECGSALLWFCTEVLRFLVGPVIPAEQQPVRIRVASDRR